MKNFLKGITDKFRKKSKEPVIVNENNVNIDTLEELIEYINNNKETFKEEQVLSESKKYIDIQRNDCSKTIAKLNEQFSILNAKIDFIEKWIEKEQEQKDKWSFKDRGVEYL